MNPRQPNRGSKQAETIMLSPMPNGIPVKMEIVNADVFVPAAGYGRGQVLFPHALRGGLIQKIFDELPVP
jgi:hypothetical protein